MPKGTQITMRGFTSVRRLCAFSMKCLSIASVMAKSAMTPSRSGRTAVTLAGVRPSISLASRPTRQTTLRPRSLVCTATTDGSQDTMPLPRT